MRTIVDSVSEPDSAAAFAARMTGAGEQPTPGFMRLVKDGVLSAWRDMQSDGRPVYDQNRERGFVQALSIG